jgi:putative Holliday junction resolvase
MPRILSIDYGQKRTGIAVTDEMQIIASGLTTIPSPTAIAFKIILPKKSRSSTYWRTQTNERRTIRKCFYHKGFVTHFSNHFPEMKVIRVDERFTSKMAFQTMIDSGLSKKKRQDKGLIDENFSNYNVARLFESKAF